MEKNIVSGQKDLENTGAFQPKRLIGDTSRVFDAALAAVIDFIYIFDTDGRFTYSNQPLLDLLGVTLDEIIGKNFFDLNYPDELADKLQRQIQQVLDSAEIVRDETPFTAPDGRSGFYEYIFTPVHGGDGAVDFVAGSTRDVTERKLAEAALRESENNLLNLADTIPQLAWMAEPDGNIFWYNRGWYEYTGMTLDEMRGWGWQGVHDPKMLPEVLRRWKLSLATVEPFEMEFPLKGADGKFRWFLTRVNPLRDSDGRIVRWFGTNTDITDRRQSEEKIRESEERFQLAQYAGNIGIWDWDASKGTTYWSETMWNLYEELPRTLQANDLLWLDHVHPDDKERIASGFEKYLKSDEPDFRNEYRIVRRDGTIRWIESIGGSILNESGELTRMYGVNLDITAQKEVEGRVRRRETQLRLVTDSIPALVSYVDNKLRYKFVNRMYAEWFGIDASEFVGKTMRAMIGSRAYDLMKPNVGEVLSGNRCSFDSTLRFTRFGRRAVHIDFVPDIAEDGFVRGFYELITDITERKHIEERLRRHENQLRLITDAMPALISYLDRSLKYRFANKTYEEWFGKTPEEIMGKTARDILGPATYRTVKPYMEKALNGEACIFETEYTRARRFVQISYVPDIAADGSVSGFYSMISDISERKQTEDRLRLSEERMRLLVASFTEHAIFSMDSEGRIEGWNTGAENLFGYKQDEILGRPVEVVFTPEDVMNAVPLKEMRSSRQNGRAGDDRWHIRKDGSRFFASGVMTPVIIGKSLVGYAKIIRDLTETKRQADALKHAHDELELRVAERTQALVETNAALIQEAHDRKIAEEQRVGLLRRIVTIQEDERRRIARDLHDQLGQRLTAMRLKIESLKELSQRDEVMLARVERLQEIGQRLDSEVSYLAWELRPTILDDLGLAKALDSYVIEWRRHFEIDAEFKTNGLPERRIDREIETNLYRVTQEALNNIVKHAKADLVSVLLEKNGDDVILIIEDNGTGFTPADQPSNGKSTTGLGLTGMKERAALIGGTLEVESAEGKGTTIFVRVPLIFDE